MYQKHTFLLKVENKLYVMDWILIRGVCARALQAGGKRAARSSQLQPFLYRAATQRAQSSRLPPPEAEFLEIFD